MKTLTNKQIQELTVAKIELDTAKAKYDQLKLEYTADLDVGRHMADGIGCIIKTEFEKQWIDWNAYAAENHPDVSKYTKTTVANSILVKPLMVKKSWL